MTDTTNEAVEVAVEKAVAEEAAVEKSQVAPEADATVEAAEASVEKAEKSDDMDEDDKEDMDEDEMSKAKSAMPEDEKTEVAKSDDALETAIADVKDTVSKAFSDLTETVKSLYEHVSELSKSLDAVKNDVTASKGAFDEFGKRIDAVAADTAFRKSGDLGEIVQEPEVKVQKSLWGGRFLTNNDLF